MNRRRINHRRAGGVNPPMTLESRCTHRGVDTPRSPRGFTLVEMLVAVALVVLIMGMFAQAFQVATGLLLRHRGTAENNQRARAVVAILEADLAKRTYRQRDDALTQRIFANETVAGQDLTALANFANQLAGGIVPLHPDYFLPGVGGKGRGVDADRERGYFYYSENDPFNDADDVLQLTVDASITDLGNEDTTPYTGRAAALGITWNTDGVGSALNQDQPIWDDGIGFKPDGSAYEPGQIGTSKSKYAEISYFIRNGNLMRRVLLIRDPAVSNPPGPIGDEAQPTQTFPGTAEFLPGNFGSGFWNGFDFSATHRLIPVPRTRFNVAGDLDNDSVSAAGTRSTALGDPRNRFGHDSRPRALQGRSKEFWDPANPSSFLGRFTQGETSDPDFLYPGFSNYAISGAARPESPFAPAALPGVVDNGNGVTAAFAEGDREGEDILMTNVHAFDVKVWDAALSEWVDIGHTRPPKNGTLGDWHITRVIGSNVPLEGTFELLNPQGNVLRNQSARRGMYRYGSMDFDEKSPQLINRVFDTWHPQFNFDTGNDVDFNGEAVPAEHMALDDPPPFRPLWSDRENFGPPPGVWVRRQGYALGDRVFPIPRVRLHQPPAGLNSDDNVYPGHQSLFYEVVGSSDGSGQGHSGLTEPAWPVAAGEEVQDGEIRWRAFNNTIGLQAVRITIRFLDPSSQQMRQVTVTHSFVEL